MNEPDLDTAIADLYRGALDNFVRRRDTLARELRSAGRRDDASAVKALRKPSRTAWALDAAALDDVDAFDALLAAIRATLDAHSSGGDVRAAMAGLRSAVRDFSSRAAQIAADAGLPLDGAALGNAVLAVLARPESLDQLRRGHLVDVPEAGGLDFLATLPVPSQQTPRSAPTTPPPSAESTRKPKATAAAARAAALEAAGELAKARQRAESSRATLNEVAAQLTAAEARLRQAEQEVNALRARAEEARIDVDDAVAGLAEAETAAASAEQRLQNIL